MKKIFFVIACSFMLAVGISAQAETSLQQSAEKVEYVIKLGDITDMSDEMLEDVLSSLISDKILEDELQCTITVTASVETDSMKIELTASVTGECDKARKEAKKLANQLLTDMKKI